MFIATVERLNRLSPSTFSKSEIFHRPRISAGVFLVEYFNVQCTDIFMTTRYLRLKCLNIEL